MPTQPRFSAASADRLKQVVDVAGAAVEAGVMPADAIAKAAEDYSLPVGHVPLAVRAVNTGSAVRQLSAGDVWTKAAAHPTASVEDVMKRLSTLPAAIKSSNDLSDYIPPEPPVRCYNLPPLLPDGVKKVAADSTPCPSAPITTRPEIDNRLSGLFKAATLIDQIEAAAEKLSAGEYVAVKEAAIKAAPQTGTYVFGRLEEAIPKTRVKAAAAPDPTVPAARHDIVAMVKELDTVRGGIKYASAPETSAGYTPVQDATGWFTRRPTHPVFGVSDPPVIQAAKKAEDSNIGRNFLEGLKTTAVRAPAWVTQKSIVEPALNLKVYPDAPRLPASTSAKLDTDLNRIDQQASVQDLLADPRFSKADPGTVVNTYRDLYALAPRAIRNPAVAADFIQRRLTTGPLSYYDIEALTKIEKNLASIERNEGDQDEEM